jgi:hypothetical protein
LGAIVEDGIHLLSQLIQHGSIGNFRCNGDQPLIEFGPAGFDFGGGGDGVESAKQLQDGAGNDGNRDDRPQAQGGIIDGTGQSKPMVDRAQQCQPK